MKHKHLALTLGAIFTSTLILLISCKKINESTSLGGDLIPVVDNITTFDTILVVEAYNDTFSVLTDTTKYSSSYENFLGQINSDPFFGKTDAQLFLELKPATFRHTFSNRPDSLHIDSVVLVLDYLETYGDTMALQTVNVYEIAPSSNFGDTSLSIRKNNYAKAGLLGSRIVQPRLLNDSVKVYKDTTANQLRIRLEDSFGQRLLDYDTTSANGHINAYSSDSAFREQLKGFALESVSGNAIMGFDLEGVNTKLAIYYKDDNGDPGNTPTAQWDTLVTYFSFAENTSSASANYIVRDYAGTPLAASANGINGTPDDLIYIQSTPGSFATIKIPGLAGLNNSVIHRAELIMEQVHDGQDTIFPPTNLYLDAYDPAAIAPKFRMIPYDVAFDGSGNSNFASFGIGGVNTKDPSGNSIKSWRFNLTRYVQHVVNDTEPVYDLRLFAPLAVRELYRPGPVGAESTLVPFAVPVNAAAGKGRVRLAGNTGAGDTNPQRMRLRIVYSKI
ncbi:MAG: DUF4270 family protein [Chitinophagaceae bacterium]